MSTAVGTYTLADSATMISRRLKHMLRHPAMTVQIGVMDHQQCGPRRPDGGGAVAALVVGDTGVPPGYQHPRACFSAPTGSCPTRRLPLLSRGTPITSRIGLPDGSRHRLVSCSSTALRPRFGTSPCSGRSNIGGGGWNRHRHRPAGRCRG